MRKYFFDVYLYKRLPELTVYCFYSGGSPLWGRKDIFDRNEVD